jgi:deoxycytidine triphosphate deaminase
MPILNGPTIQKRVKNNELIVNALYGPDGEAVVEAASYDLRAGIVLWRERDSSELEVRYFTEGQPIQPFVTLQPGQMIFVISHEELKLDASVSGTVYSRNKLQKENVLALNAGHVDPGYEGPILIRLINLGSQPWAITLGEAVFTVVFHTVEPDPAFKPKDRRTKADTLESAKKTTVVTAFSNPFHDLYKAEIARQLQEHYSNAESDIRRTLTSEFFLKKELSWILFQIFAVLITAVFLLSRMPWEKVWNAVKCILHL